MVRGECDEKNTFSIITKKYRDLVLKIGTHNAYMRLRHWQVAFIICTGGYGQLENPGEG